MRRLAASLEQHRQTATISGGKLRTLWISCDVRVLVDTVGASVQTRIVDFEISFRRNMERFKLETASDMLCWRFGEKTRRKAASPTKLKSDPLNKKSTSTLLGTQHFWHLGLAIVLPRSQATSATFFLSIR
jgi:hypothetical protein